MTTASKKQRLSASARVLGDRAFAAISAVEGIALSEGVYAGVLGPSYETPAEIRMLRTLGADVVGMSTVHEVIALRHRAVRVGTLSVVTNLAAGLSPKALDHADVQAAADAAHERLSRLMQRWILAVGSEPADA